MTCNWISCFTGFLDLKKQISFHRGALNWRRHLVILERLRSYMRVIWWHLGALELNLGHSDGHGRPELDDDKNVVQSKWCQRLRCCQAHRATDFLQGDHRAPVKMNVTRYKSLILAATFWICFLRAGKSYFTMWFTFNASRFNPEMRFQN